MQDCPNIAREEGVPLMFTLSQLSYYASLDGGKNGLPSTGIPYVIVNGTVVVDNNKVLPIKPGQAIRYPFEHEGRFEPLETHSRLGEITIPILQFWRRYWLWSTKHAATS